MPSPQTGWRCVNLQVENESWRQGGLELWSLWSLTAPGLLWLSSSLSPPYYQHSLKSIFFVLEAVGWPPTSVFSLRPAVSATDASRGQLLPSGKLWQTPHLIWCSLTWGFYGLVSVLCKHESLWTFQIQELCRSLHINDNYAGRTVPQAQIPGSKQVFSTEFIVLEVRAVFI